MRILEEFWYGNIESTEYNTASCKEYKKLLELICRNGEKLKATMTDEQKELFEKYTDCVREHQTITDCLIFQNVVFKEHLKPSHFIRCKKCNYFSKTRCNFCNCVLYYTCIIMTEVRVCTELLLKSY